MSELLHDPFVQSSLLPLALSVLIIGVLHWFKRPIAVAGIAIALLVMFTLVVGLPALPPPSSMGKLFWASAAGVVLGAAIDMAGVKGRAGSACIGAWIAASLVWIGLPVLDDVAQLPTLLVLLAVGAWIAFAGLPGRSDGPIAPAASLLALALAVGGVALIGSSASIAQLALALTAATGGFLLWNWPFDRHAWGMSGKVGLGITVLLAAVLALFTQAQAIALLLAVPALLAGRVGRCLPMPETRIGQAAKAAAITVIAVLPALAAIGAAYLLGGGEASPY